ncbi:hypothetical protein SLA2020_169930 [Shorea laevis]
MADEIRARVCTHIDEKLQALSSTFLEHTTFRVPSQLYEVNEKAYEPEIISIGPYHRGKSHLKMMEVHKVRFLRMLLRRTVSILPNYILDLIFSSVLHDVILFENQLPFFVLWELFGMMRENERNLYVQSLLLLFYGKIPGRVDVAYDNTSIRSVKHLLDLAHGNWLPSREVMEDYSRVPKDGNWSFIRSATELKEAGIRFKKSEGNSLFDIRFRNEVLEIPTIKILDTIESLYRNVIICEQFENKSPRYFTDFAKFIDCLINSGKDVKLLCHCRIIDNWLGDDEAVATMFNRLRDHVNLSPKEDFFYARICNDVNEHYNAPWNKRMGSLRHNYFNTPWAFISFLAAAFLLLLTLLQTTFTIFPRK